MFSRAKQQLKEKVGREVTKTSYDADYECDCQHVEKTKENVDKMLDKIKSLISIYSGTPKTDGVGNTAISFAPGIQAASPTLGKTLLMIGKSEQKIASLERTFHDSVEKKVVLVLRTWIKEVHGEFSKQRDILKKKRLDMDAANTKARSKPDDAEVKQRVEDATAAHDSQMEVMKAILSTFPSHYDTIRQAFKTFSTLHRDYFTQSAEAIQVCMEAAA